MKALRAELGRALREKDRARLRELRAAIVEARELRRARVKAAKLAAREGVARARGDLRALRKALADATRAASRVGRYVAPGAKAVGAASVATEVAKHEAALRAATMTLDDERRAQRTERIWTRPGAKLSTAKERVEESDTHVAANIDPELRPAWEAVKRTIHATARKSRTEAFMQWVHDNPEDAARYAWQADERKLAELEREERELAREASKASRYSRSAHALAADVAAVPF